MVECIGYIRVSKKQGGSQLEVTVIVLGKKVVKAQDVEIFLAAPNYWLRRDVASFYRCCTHRSVTIAFLFL